MARLRIALVSEHASPAALLGGADAGGQNVAVDQLARHLAHLGHAVDVFTRREAADAPAVVDWAPGVRIVNLDAGPPHPVPKDALWPLMPAFRDALLAFIVRDSAHPDLVHGHFWMSGWVALELRRALGAPVVQTFHALGRTKRREQGDADTSPPERIAVETAIARAADALIAQCPSEREELIDGYGAAPSRVALVPAAVDVDAFRPISRVAARRRIGLAGAGGGPVVVYVGRLLPRKDVGNVVRAVALLRHSTAPPPLLLVVGGATAAPDPVATPEIGVLRALAASLGVADRVRFAGRRQPAELRYWYGAGDVAVTTPWYEPFGLTPLEAMACGRPVVGAAVGGIPYTVVDGLTGALVPPRDPAALAERLGAFLADPARCARMGRAARARVEREFTWAGTAGRTAALYAAVLAGLPIPEIEATGRPAVPAPADDRFAIAAHSGWP